MTRVGIVFMVLVILFYVHQQEMEGLEKRGRGWTKASNLDLMAGKSWTIGAFALLVYGLIVNRFWVPLGAGAACALLDYCTFLVLRRMHSVAFLMVWVRLHDIICIILIPFELVAALCAGALNAWKGAKKA